MAKQEKKLGRNPLKDFKPKNTTKNIKKVAPKLADITHVKAPPVPKIKRGK